MRLSTTLLVLTIGVAGLGCQRRQLGEAGIGGAGVIGAQGAGGAASATDLGHRSQKGSHLRGDCLMLVAPDHGAQLLQPNRRLGTLGGEESFLRLR